MKLRMKPKHIELAEKGPEGLKIYPLALSLSSGKVFICL